MSSAIFTWQISKQSVAAALLAACLLVAAACGAEEEKPLIKSAAKPTATKEHGSESAKAAQKPRVVDLSAVWCAPCKKFTPLFEKVKAEMGDKAQFDSLDTADGEGKVLYEKYQVDGLPAVLLFNAKGKMVRKHEGTWTEAQLKKAVNKVIQ